MKKIIISSLILLFLDMCWLNLFMGKQYHRMIPQIQGTKMVINYYYAILAYILMIIGLQVYVLPNIKRKKLILSSLKYGFLFGIILFGVYDFTAGALIKDWDAKLAILDVLWGGLLYFITTLATIKICELLDQKLDKTSMRES